MAQQTAVEWLLQNIQKVDKMDWDLLFFHAKKMEKEQIKQAYADGSTDIGIMFSEQYYNETYKNNEQ